MSADHSILPLQLRSVCYRPGKNALLQEISLTLVPRYRSILLGPNGAGKSLLLRLCHGLIKPSSGEMRWNGLPMDAGIARRQAMVFQRPVLLRRSVRANIEYALQTRGVTREARRDRVDSALKLAGLEAFADRPATVLSGGEQQRVALARAWAVAPELLFLDEPTANLDPAATRAVEAVIATIADAGTKIIMTTHDLGQARRLADEVLFLHHGRVLEQTPADEFFAAPRSEAATAFLRGDLLW